MRLIRFVRDIVRAIFSREKLPTDIIAPVEEPRGFWARLQWLLCPESLPQDHAITETRAGILAWIFKPEHLPQDPIPEGMHKGFWARVVEKEPLPLDSEDSSRS